MVVCWIDWIASSLPGRSSMSRRWQDGCKAGLAGCALSGASHPRISKARPGVAGVRGPCAVAVGRSRPDSGPGFLAGESRGMALVYGEYLLGDAFDDGVRRRPVRAQRADAGRPGGIPVALRW